MNARSRRNFHTATLCVVLAPFALALGWGSGYALDAVQLANSPRTVQAVTPTQAPTVATPAVQAPPTVTVERIVDRAPAVPAPPSVETPAPAPVPAPARVAEPVPATTPAPAPVEEEMPTQPAPEDSAPVEDPPVPEAPLICPSDDPRCPTEKPTPIPGDGQQE